METIRLEFNPNIKTKILEVLSSFSSDELKIIKEDEFFDENFDENKKKLDIALAKVKNGKAESCSLEELDAFLEKTISEYEN